GGTLCQSRIALCSGGAQFRPLLAAPQVFALSRHGIHRIPGTDSGGASAQGIFRTSAGDDRDRNGPACRRRPRLVQTANMNIFDDSALDPIAREIWDMKYRFKRLDGSTVDGTIADSWRRVAAAVAMAEA